MRLGSLRPCSVSQSSESSSEMRSSAASEPTSIYSTMYNLSNHQHASKLNANQCHDLIVEAIRFCK
jgi:hypothetical protein